MGRPITEYPEAPSDVTVDLFSAETDLLRVALDIFADEVSEESRERLEAAIASRDEAIERAADAADPEWMDRARWVVYEIALMREEFTTDAVWALLERRGVPPPREPKALGSVMKFGQRAGWIEPTDRVRQSTQGTNNARPKTIWRSRIKGKEIVT